MTGDIRDISERDFPALESLYLPHTVRGGMDHQFQSIAEVPSFMQAIHRILQRYPKTSSEGFYSFWSLSQDSPDWYARARNCPVPTFRLQIIQAGYRIGWRWYSIDPEYMTHMNSARSTGLIKSQAVKTVTTSLTLSWCKVFSKV